MRALLTSIAVAGDVNPFIALGQALRARGHRATVLVNPLYQAQVFAAGLGFAPLGTAAESNRLRNAAFMRRPRTGLRHLWRQGVMPGVPLLLEALETLIRSDPPDIVIYHPASVGVPWVCQRHRIPHSVLTLAPQAWTMYNTGRVHAEASPCESPRERWHRGLLRLARPLCRGLVDRGLNRIRAQYGFPPARDIYVRQYLDSDLNLGLWSPLFRGSLSHDPRNGRICGFPWFDRGHGVEQADDDIRRFLDDGEPPVVFTMGTTVITAAGHFYEWAAEACQRLGRRGLLLTGSVRNMPKRTPVGVRAFEYAPFSTVLPRGCATVHHGGIGTTGQALRAGKPSVIIPVAWDQFDNANWARRLKVSVTLERARVSPKTLAVALGRVLERPAVVARAARLGCRIAREDGAVTAVEAIEALVAGRCPAGRSG
jgi:UDP:flavonoid glycosyltransferase YjiC (YdhE family)